MRTVHLHGYLGQKFGKAYTLSIDSPVEAVRALGVQLPGFAEMIRAGNWHVIRGPLEEKDSVDLDGIEVSLGIQREIHIIPAIEGANSGLGMIIVGAILIAAAFFTGGASLAAWGALQVGLAGAGIGMMVGGLVAMTTKMPGVDDATKGSVDERASYLFNGPTNQSAQGVAVPRGYGRLMVGSIVVSAGIFAEETDS